MKKLYLECETGISGDMIVASLLDLGADRAVLDAALAGMKDEGFEIVVSRVSKAGIDCCDFNVVLDAAHENHDHDMEYLYGHTHGHEHTEHVHDHEHTHTDEEHTHLHEESGHVHTHESAEEAAHEHHDHEHDHDHHHNHHHGRNLHEIETIIDRLDMTENAKSLAKKVFLILAKAEAKAHNRPVGEVHFHEVGAVDSIVDIVSAAVCFDNLGIDEVIVTGISEGQGSVRCQHGILPIPVPAVLNIATEYGLPIRITNRQGELITPTGAAFVAAVLTDTKLPENIRIVKTGYGAGKREYKQPSILRAMLLEKPQVQSDTIWKLESNIDDSTGEQLGFVLEELMKAGARDVFYVPAFMKKNRPAWVLSVIATEDRIEELERIIFRDTTTIGIRRQRMERTVAERKNETVQTPYGEATVKVCSYRDITKVYPEYESVARLAKETGVAFDTVYRSAAESYRP